MELDRTNAIEEPRGTNRRRAEGRAVIHSIPDDTRFPGQHGVMIEYAHLPFHRWHGQPDAGCDE